MPTGYTYPVVEGKISDFPTFAMTCARAFGALVTMRDDPADAPIPEEFKPSDWNEKRLAESRAKLAEIQALTPEQAEAVAAAEYTAALASHEEYERKEQEAEQRLDAMLEKVNAWKPPTAEHVEMKNFMIEQIRISKRGDYRSKPPEKLGGRDWMREKIEKLHHDIGYHAAEHAKEVARAAGRTEWIKALRASLAA